MKKIEEYQMTAQERMKAKKAKNRHEFLTQLSKAIYMRKQLEKSQKPVFNNQEVPRKRNLEDLFFRVLDADKPPMTSA
jgi:hypothetical protein